MGTVPFFIILLVLSSPLFAQDIGLNDKDSAWLLLQDPIGQSGDGLNEFADDPGQPILNPLGWPGGNWPTTELWHFDAKTGKFRQATDFLGSYIDEASKKNWRRTLTSVVRINDTPHVLHYDPFKLSGHMSALLLVNEAAASAKGKVPEANIAFKSDKFFDAPEVSPDGKRIVLRFWISVGSGYKSEIRMYSLPEFKHIVTSEQSTHSRPVWMSNNSVAVVTWPKGEIPYQRAMNVSRSRDNPKLHTRNAHDKGMLVQLSEVKGLLKSDAIREAYFLGDKTRRTLVFDGTRLAWVEDELGKPQVLAKDMNAGGVSVIVEGFKGFQGLSANEGEILSTVYGHSDNPGKLCIIKSFLNPPKKKEGPEDKDEVVDDEKKANELLVVFLRGGDRTIHASMLDFGNGMLAFAEPVANHNFSMEAKSTQPAIQHTLRVPSVGFDSLRNPRMLVQISRMMRSFSQFDTGKAELASTQLIFDVDVVSGKNQRSGRMIEVYHAASRKGKGAIRIEDNLGGGAGTFRSIYDDRGSDFYYSGPDTAGGVKKQTKEAAGKAFDELESQLNARRMLT
ncbi:MAG: hypothetical protein L3J82_03135, partial [Planctomycetes bacterium]|nr:hypothetical protein [Planctomycetota bacterium]